jgi:hypothetical protein
MTPTTTQVSGYHDALASLRARGSGPAPDSAGAKAGIARFRELFSDLTEESIRAQLREVYAAEVYFNDTLKEIRGVDALEAYMLESARAVESCRVLVDDVASSEGNFYLRWRMEIRFRRFKRGVPTRSIGVSHLRLDDDGRVALHQDFWDAASGLFEHVPVLGYGIRAIKSRL